MSKPLNVPDKWRKPLKLTAYAGVATAISAALCFWLVYIFAIVPQDHAIDISRNQNAKINVVVKKLDGLVGRLNRQTNELNHQAYERQRDTNAFAGAICATITRQLQVYHNPKTHAASKAASYKQIVDSYHFLKELSPHPPTKCSNLNLKP